MAKRDDNRASKRPLSPLQSTGQSARKPQSKARPLTERTVSVPELLLRNTVWRLRLARSIVTTAAIALAHQNADADADIAFVLHKAVTDNLTGQMETLNRVLGIDEP